MSSQSSSRVRRNGSPSTATKQGPIKAVQSFTLKSTSKSSSTSPRDANKILSRKSPDGSKLSPESRSPSFSVSLSPPNVSPRSSSTTTRSSIITQQISQIKSPQAQNISKRTGKLFTINDK